MSNVYTHIKDALVRAIKRALPDMDVSSEYLAKTDYGSNSNITDYIYTGLQSGCQPFSSAGNQCASVQNV